MSDPNDPKLPTFVKQSSKFQYETAIKLGFDDSKIKQVYYRPFDWRSIYFSDYFIERQRKDVTKHMAHEDNIGLGFSRTVTGSYTWQDIQVIKGIAEFGYMATRVGNGAPVAPLYLYDEIGKVANLEPKLLALLLSKVDNSAKVKPEDVLDYVYASLHSPTYREKYKDFLKSDFPRIPIPKDNATFVKLVELGGKLRRLHLLDEKELGTLTTTFPQAGNNEVEKVEYKNNKVYINDTQYFDGVNREVFDFYIGGYQPAQKWLKDRKGHKLEYQDITHYEQMIQALDKTTGLMQRTAEVTK